jgi:hypothetical protein
MRDTAMATKFTNLVSPVMRLFALAFAVLIATTSVIAQTNAPRKRVGILAPQYCPAPDGPTRIASSLLQALAELGWVEGRTLIADCLAPGEHTEQVPALAADRGDAREIAGGFRRMRLRGIISHGVSAAT